MAQGQYQFYPQGCLHNGNRAVCSFVAVYSGASQANVNAWAGYGGQWTANLQFVDNAHVPHAADAAYFIDSFGARQPTLFIQQGTQASITVEFPSVDPAVTGGEFHLGNQIIGGIAVNQANYAVPSNNLNAQGLAPQPAMMQPGAPQQQPGFNGAAPPVPTNMPQQQMAMQPQQQQACTPQNANTPLCRANDKVNGATTQVTSMTQSAQVLSGTLKSLFGKSGTRGSPGPCAGATTAVSTGRLPAATTGVPTTGTLSPATAALPAGAVSAATGATGAISAGSVPATAAPIRAAAAAWGAIRSTAAAQSTTTATLIAREHRVQWEAASRA